MPRDTTSAASHTRQYEEDQLLSFGDRGDLSMEKNEKYNNQEAPVARTAPGWFQTSALKQ